MSRRKSLSIAVCKDRKKHEENLRGRRGDYRIDYGLQGVCNLYILFPIPYSRELFWMVQILERLGSKVSLDIVAEAFSPDTTSDVAAGLWEPHLIGGTPKEKVE